MIFLKFLMKNLPKMSYKDFSIGLTGGIGSGKTMVANLFAEQGATIVDTDDVARNLTLPGGEAIEPIRKEFGEEFIQPDGAMNRSLMRELVFSRADERLKLEAILHPLIRKVSIEQAEAATGTYVIFVIPLLVELPIWHGMGTRILAVDCPEELQIERVMKRNNMSREQVTAIMAAQATRQQRLAIADDVIVNDKSVGEVLKEVQVVLAIITGICGIIVAVGEKDIYGEFSFLLFLTALIPYVVATAILIGLGWLGDIFCTAFADIHFYLRSLNKVAHGSTNGEKNGINTMPSISDQNNDTWKCRNCGRILKTYQTTCTCGQKKSEN